MDCKLGDFLCSQNQTATWKLKVIRQKVYHDIGNAIPIIPVCGSSSLFTFCELWFGNHSCGWHSPFVVGILPCVVNPSPVCGGSFARVWLSIRPCVVVHSPWCTFVPCGCIRHVVAPVCVCGWSFAFVWWLHSPVCG